MRKFLLLVLLLAGSSLHGFAQADCFEYYDEGKTIITGLTAAGQAATTLTLPKEVTTVRSGAFSSAAKASALIIENGGNPAFEPNLFGTTEVSDIEEPNANRLSDIQILGSSMTVANIRALFTSLVAQGALTTVYIEGYSGDWIDIPVSEESPSEADEVLLSVLTHDVTVTMPAALVSTQQFGNAQVYGRFTIERELITFCGIVTFEDTDDGSNMLFYVADSYDEEKGCIHIQRVHYVKGNEGILIHNIKNTSTYADLPRVSGSIGDEQLYGKNMLKGVVVPTTIGATEEEGKYTNMVLYNGSFIRTSGGTLGANRAYLRMLTKDLKGVPANAKLSLSFGDDETTDIETMSDVRGKMSDVWYDLSGRKIVNPSNGQMPKGIYIQKGKKYVVR